MVSGVTTAPTTLAMQGRHITEFTVWERSHMTSAAEGGGVFEMLTVADKGGGGGGGV